MAEEHDLCVRLDLRAKVYCIPADPTYNIRMTQNDDYEEHDVFGVNDAKDRAKVLERSMKQRIHERCSAPLYSFHSGTRLFL